MSIAFLLVTCCREQSRAEILAEVIKNLHEQAPELYETLTVFDNASTIPGTIDVLRDSFTHVYQSDKNVGFWSAIDWWLDHLNDDPPQYVYIIESDLIHSRWNKLWECAAFLDRHPGCGGVRTHEYVVAERPLYDKDHPRRDSKRHAWRSHKNIITGQRVDIDHAEDDLYVTTFPAHVPALNRYSMMDRTFKKLRQMPGFTEHDFQRACHEQYQQMGLIDGGLFKELAYNGAGAVGSFMSPDALKKMGYQTTRSATITPQDQYKVSRL